jgi:hypothetical protein
MEHTHVGATLSALSRPALILLTSFLLAACEPADDDPDRVEILEIVSADLPDGRVGEPFAAAVQARGGRAPYVFRGGSGQLPPGLSLHEDGRVDGTPTDDGSFPFEVVVADDRGDRARRALEVDIRPEDEPPSPLRFVTALLPTADLGEPYGAALEAEGGRPPYGWRLVLGRLPDGLSLDSEGAEIAGVPTELGVQVVTIRLEDASGMDAQDRELELAVSPAPELLTEVLPIGVAGEPYQAQLEVAGGAWPLSYEAYSGTLPEGLTLQPSGLIAGTPVESDSRPVRFRVTDASGVIRERRIRVWVVDDRPWEGWSDLEVPPNCGLEEPIVVRGTVLVDDPAMIARVQVAVDVTYDDMGMVDIDAVAPDGTRVRLHVGGPRAGGAHGIHFLYERDRISWGSFSPWIGMGPRGTWALEVRVLPDPGFGCVDRPGRLQRFAVVLGPETSSEDYLRVRGVSPNNLIDGPFARITGGGLDQDEFDLAVEEWSTGANGVPEGGTGDDELLGAAAVLWASDLPAEVGVLAPDGHFQSGEATGQGILTGEVGERTIELPVKVVPPDWVP